MTDKPIQFEDVLIGHSAQNNTGVTVIRFAQPVCCSYFVPGAAPATRDVELLKPEAGVKEIHALCFGGGSAFGLGAADGVMEYLSEQDVGLKTKFKRIPIVPTACIYDFINPDSDFPKKQLAYRACVNSHENNFLIGQIGAATSALVGTYAGDASAGGFGCALLYDQRTQLKVLACAVVNALGDIYDNDGKIIAGAKNEKGDFIGINKAIVNDMMFDELYQNQANTSLVAVITNAKLDKPALARIAKMASAGMARAIQPAFSLYDGDIIFTASTAKISVSEVIVGQFAALATQHAIINSVTSSADVAINLV